MNGLEKWAKENGLEKEYKSYLFELEEMREELELEGLPGNGSTAELRIAEIQKSYPELFGDE